MIQNYIVILLWNMEWYPTYMVHLLTPATGPVARVDTLAQSFDGLCETSYFHQCCENPENWEKGNLSTWVKPRRSFSWGIQTGLNAAILTQFDKKKIPTFHLHAGEPISFIPQENERRWNFPPQSN